MAKSDSKAAPARSGAVDAYLIVYNVACGLGWLYMGVTAVKTCLAWCVHSVTVCDVVAKLLTLCLCLF